MHGVAALLSRPVRHQRRAVLFGMAGAVSAIVLGAAATISLGLGDLSATLDPTMRGIQELADVAAVVGAFALAACLTGGWLSLMRIAAFERDRRAGEARDRTRLEAVLDAIDVLPEGFVLFDADDRLVACNEAFRVLHAASADALQPGTRLQDIMRGSVAKARDSTLRGATEIDIGAGSACRKSRPPTMRDQQFGDNRWFRLQEFWTRSGGRVGLHSDITETKLAREAAATAADALWETDAEHCLVSVSDGFEQATGVTAAAAIGKWRLNKLLDAGAVGQAGPLPSTILAAHLAFRDLMATIETPNGGVRHMTLSGAPVRDVDGSFRGYRGTQRDVTERIEAERALTRQTDILSRLIETLPVGVSVVDADQTVVAFNQLVPEMLRLPPGAYRVGMNLDDFIRCRIKRGFPDASEAEIEAIVRRSQEFGPSEGRYRRFQWTQRDGLSIDGRRATLPDGGYIDVMIDVSEQRRREADLEEARVLADSANKAKSEFLTNISHELRTPMYGIVGMNSLLLETRLDDVQREYAELVQNSAASLLTLLNDILDVSKLEAGQVGIESVEFDLATLIRDVMALFGPQALEKELKLGLQVAPLVSRWYTGDPTRLRQVLVNLVGNAIKFTERGSVTVVARREALADLGVDRLFIEVGDTGIGIHEESRGRLFQRFSQADGSITRRFGGTGLGLSIAKQLTELMGGEIGVTSKLGEGSKFWFTVPLKAADRASHSEAGKVDEASAPLPLVDAAAPAGRRILVADDNPVNRKIATILLSQAGYTVVAAADGREAVDALGRDIFDLVLMDVQMPVMGGVEATQRIRKLVGKTGQLPIVAMTAHAMDGARERYLAAGMDDYLAKPFAREALLTIVARWVGGRPAVPADKLATVIVAPREPVIDEVALGALRDSVAAALPGLIDDFLAGSGELVASIEAATSSADLAALARAAHDLVATAGNFGARELASLAARLGRAARSGANAEALALAAEIDATATRAASAISSWLAAHAA